MILPKTITEPAICLKDQFFDLKGLSAYSSLAVPTIRDHLRKGKLRYYKVGGKVLIKKSDFDVWIETFMVNKKQNLNSIVGDVLSRLKPKK